MNHVPGASKGRRHVSSNPAASARNQGVHITLLRSISMAVNLTKEPEQDNVLSTRIAREIRVPGVLDVLTG